MTSGVGTEFLIFSFNKLLFLSCLSEELCSEDLCGDGHYQDTDNFLV